MAPASQVLQTQEIKIFRPQSRGWNAYEAITNANKRGLTLAPNPLVDSILNDSSKESQLKKISSALPGYTGTIKIKKRVSTDSKTGDLWVVENLPPELEKQLNRHSSVYGFMNHGFVEKKGKGGKAELVPNLDIIKCKGSNGKTVYVVNFLNPDNIELLEVLDRVWGLPDKRFGVSVKNSFDRNPNARCTFLNDDFGPLVRGGGLVHDDKRDVLGGYFRPSTGLGVVAVENQSTAASARKQG